MMLKQLTKYDNAPALEATWADENDVVVKCQAYSNGQMDMLRADLGVDAAAHEALIAEVEATYVPPAPVPLAERQATIWNLIKAERDRRAALGVKVGQHWYHSDADSRIQQLSLFVMGASVPPIQWKTLTTTPPPVFVIMTQAIAAGIFQNTAASDAAIFAAAETHRVTMEAMPDPENYDCSGGWPASIEDTP